MVKLDEISALDRTNGKGGPESFKNEWVLMFDLVSGLKQVFFTFFQVEACVDCSYTFGCGNGTTMSLTQNNVSFVLPLRILYMSPDWSKSAHEHGKQLSHSSFIIDVFSKFSTLL